MKAAKRLFERTRIGQITEEDAARLADGKT